MSRGWQCLKQNLSELFEEFINLESVIVNGKNIIVEKFLGGDLKFSNQVMGIDGKLDYRSFTGPEHRKLMARIKLEELMPNHPKLSDIMGLWKNLNGLQVQNYLTQII